MPSWIPGEPIRFTFDAVIMAEDIAETEKRCGSSRRSPLQHVRQWGRHRRRK
jgi:hypothetical protein